MKNATSQEPGPVSAQEIARHLYQAATADPWRPAHHLVRGDTPSDLIDTPAAQIQRSLDRAQRKTFVRAPKPLRRLLRNQGAVNESLIEAVYHLSAQSQKMIVEITDLRRQVVVLQKQLRPAPPLTDGAQERPQSG